MAENLDSALQTKSFRLDINGLRAWAVVAVVLYHFGVSGIQGGFVGVDIFFVISGFLMTGIILGGLESGNFSVWKFYWARARRILPALVVLCAVLLPIGWFLLMTSEYQTLGRHVRDSLWFNSNLQYLSESGYFDSDAHEKWLLHTWSLSVEWQFYLVYPLVLLAVGKCFPTRRAYFVALVALLVASLLWCVMLTYSQPVVAFFKLWTRAWEMLAGGVLFLLADKIKLSEQYRRYCAWLGLLLIIVALVIFTPESQWPGWRALLPVSGAVLVLLAQHESSRWMGGFTAQWLGDRSYSIYLWHWPVVVALAYFELGDKLWWVLFGIFLSIALGHLSYVLVENPSRRYLSRIGTWRGALWLLSVTVLVIIAGQMVRKSGFPDRLPEIVRKVESARFDVNPRRDKCQDAQAACIYGGDQLEGIVLGDSHADAVVNAVAGSLDKPQGLLFKGESGCLVMASAKNYKPHTDCEVLNRWVADELPDTLPGKPVILINALPGYALGSGDSYDNLGRPKVYFDKRHALSTPIFRQEFRKHYLETVCTITKSHPLYVMRPIPEMPSHVPNFIGRALLRGEPGEVYQTLSEYHKRNDFILDLQNEAAERCGVFILNPLPYLCDQQYCFGSEQGLPLYTDDSHLNEAGNRRLIPLFSPVFTRLVQTAVDEP